MFEGLNAVYEEHEKRSFVRLNAVSLAFTMGLIGFAVLNGKTQSLEDDINEASVQVLNLVVTNRQKVNLAGLPGMSIPCGYDSKHLPIGMQLIGPPFSEETILRAGDAFERSGASKPRATAI